MIAFFKKAFSDRKISAQARIDRANTRCATVRK